MGADLITYFCYGPKKLSEKKIPKAEAQAAAAINAAQKIVELFDHQATEETSDEAFRKALGEIDQKPLKHLLGEQKTKRFMTILVSEDDLYDLRKITRLNPKKAVEDLVQVWNHGSRDSTWRPVPGHRNLVGHVAGELSWGDEPDGYGYQTLQNANLLGLLPIFNIQ